ncbi:multiple C2 and transmembrane domain-containing protein-like [Choristoneura fumiferana]|uniref:multiple C2 and transmembrane domain-containing protein-like n=1 Tax=Choristoneura fumiferana TaxID=7141 RepID=UPI003D15B6FB
MKLDKEKTHELRQELDDGFGEIHLYVTMCTIRDNSPSQVDETSEGDIWKKKQYDWFNLQELLQGDVQEVGQLHVRVVAARGLNAKPNAYCTLELHNQQVQTHSCRATSEPAWNKRYVFNVYDITSTLDVKINDSSLRSSFRNESLGIVSIPLFRIVNGEMRWYALKDMNKRNGAKGNHPRVLLQMSMMYNPTKAALKLFRPKEVKYLDKPKKLDLDVVYKNTVFIQDLFNFLHFLNDAFMRLFEWDNQELSVIMLIGWLVFWFYFRAWTIPLFLLAPFVFHLKLTRVLECNLFVATFHLSDKYIIVNSFPRLYTFFFSFFEYLDEVNCHFEFCYVYFICLVLYGQWPIFPNVDYVFAYFLAEKTLETSYRNYDDGNLMNSSERHEQSLKGKVQALPEIAAGIIANIELLVSLVERLYNLGTFKVPFLSYVTMMLLVVMSFVVYVVPFNYLLMGLGVYKFIRKYLNPDRKLNNDLVDFISRIPDNEIWKDWKELSVPEPLQCVSDNKLTRSFSDNHSDSDLT